MKCFLKLLLVVAISFSSLAMTGCGASGAATAITIASVTGGLYAANLAGTQSKIEVKVEHFDRKGLPSELFAQPKLALKKQGSRSVDVIAEPSDHGIRQVMKALVSEDDDSPMRRLIEVRPHLNTTIHQLSKYLKIVQDGRSKTVADGQAKDTAAEQEIESLEADAERLKKEVIAAETQVGDGNLPTKKAAASEAAAKVSKRRLEHIQAQAQRAKKLQQTDEAIGFLSRSRNELTRLKNHNEALLNALKACKYAFDQREADGLDKEDIKAIVPLLSTVRNAALIDNIRVSGAYFDLLLPALDPATHNKLSELVSGLDDFTVDRELQETRAVLHDEGISFSKRMAIALGPWLETLSKFRLQWQKMKVNDDAVIEELSTVLSHFGIVLKKEELSSLIPSKPGIPAPTEQVELAMRKGSVVSNSFATSRKAYELTFTTFAVDFNLGSIRNEAMQVLLTSDATRHLLDDENDKKRWRTFSYAKSRGAVGNHDTIIYLENMGLPILKSSAFDPTKFQVANGRMFRKVFSAVADIYALPKSSVAGQDDKPTPVGSINLKSIRDARAQSRKQAAANMQKIITAARATVSAGENGQSLKAANQQERNSLRDGLKKQLNDAAQALRATSSQE